MDDETARHYVLDLGQLINEQALQAKADRDEATGSSRDFKAGRLMAYHEVVSLMQEQAIAFGIDVGALRLEDVNPERDLL